MNVLILQVFVSLLLVAGMVLLFVYSIRQRDYEHADRLSLFPLEDDTARAPRASRSEPHPDSLR